MCKTYNTHICVYSVGWVCTAGMLSVSGCEVCMLVWGVHTVDLLWAVCICVCVCGVCVGSMLMVGCVYMRGVYIVWDVYAVGML